MTPAEIRAFRQEFKMTQEDLAAEIGLSQSQLSKIERGSVPAPFTLVDYMKGCKSNKVYDGEVPKIIDIQMGSDKFLKQSLFVLSGSIRDRDEDIPFLVRLPKSELTGVDEDALNRICTAVATRVGDALLDLGFKLGAKRVAKVYRQIGNQISAIADL